MLCHFTDAAFFQRKSKKRGDGNGEGRNEPGRRLSPLCIYEPLLHEIDQLLLDADLPDRQGELFGGVYREQS